MNPFFILVGAIACRVALHFFFLKKYLNASKPFEHPPSGEKCLKA